MWNILMLEGEIQWDKLAPSSFNAKASTSTKQLQFLQGKAPIPFKNNKAKTSQLNFYIVTKGLPLKQHGQI